MDRYNSEGYPDLPARLGSTAYEALTAMTKAERIYKPLVYIASPFAGDIEYNIGQAKQYCRFAVFKNAIPLAPHLHYPQFMNDSDKAQREQGLFFALVLLGKCDELWVFGDKISNGMMREIAKAEKRGIPVRRFKANCEEVF